MQDVLPLTADEVLTTTRAVRRRLNFNRPVPRSVIIECTDIAQQAPVGSNFQHWHFVVVEDSAKKEAIAGLYRQAYAGYRASPIYATAHPTGDITRDTIQTRVADSADYLAEHLGESPALVIPCIERRLNGVEVPMALNLSCILPAAWSFMLAARARGLGTCWTTNHLRFEAEVARILDIPHAEIAQTMLTPVAYTLGSDFKPAKRPDPATITHFDTW